MTRTLNACAFLDSLVSNPLTTKPKMQTAAQEPSSKAFWGKPTGHNVVVCPQIPRRGDRNSAATVLPTSSHTATLQERDSFSIHEEYHVVMKSTHPSGKGCSSHCCPAYAAQPRTCQVLTFLPLKHLAAVGHYQQP